MNLPLNHNTPTIMHIDLNSCFATVEQQAYPNLRGKPIVIAAYTSPNGCVLAPSIEAKRLGIKTGMTVRDARLLCRNIIVRDPDPAMIRHAHLKFKNVLKNYSPNVTPKSIDELVIDFTDTLALKRGLKEIGLEIKKEIRQAVGEWISCNVGISTNRFLAKLAAGLHKPDGLDIVTSDNLEQTYAGCTLLSLNGINTHFQARLNANNIFTPSDFLHASLETLQKKVFQSINGYYWYLRLRGWEIDAAEFGRKSYGQSYALKEPTCDSQKIARLMMKLCEKMGRRLRRRNFTAFGLHVAIVYTDFSHWHTGRTFSTDLYTVQELFTKAVFLLNQQPERRKVRTLAVSCYHLSPTQPEQLSIEEVSSQKRRKVQDAVDRINNRWGEYVITPLLMLGMQDVIVDRIAFGGAKEIEDLYVSN